jgi:hypothetical protein
MRRTSSIVCSRPSGERREQTRIELTRSAEVQLSPHPVHGPAPKVFRRAPHPRSPAAMITIGKSSAAPEFNVSVYCSADGVTILIALLSDDGSSISNETFKSRSTRRVEPRRARIAPRSVSIANHEPLANSAIGFRLVVKSCAPNGSTQDTHPPNDVLQYPRLRNMNDVAIKQPSTTIKKLPGSGTGVAAPRIAGSNSGTALGS